MSNISKLVWTGVAVESPSGTAAATPTIYVPCTSKFQNKTKYVYSKEERGTRDGNNVRTGTTRMATGSVDGDVYLASIPYFLYAFMGGITSTQPDSTNAPTAYQHALALADVPPSLTVFKGYDSNGMYWAYSVVDKMKFKFSADGKLLEHSTSLQSQYKQPVTAGTTYDTMNDPVYLTGDYEALAGYAPAITVGGSAANDIEEVEIDLEQKITLYFSARGNRGFYKADFGERTAKASFTARFEDVTWTDKETNDTREVLDVKFTGKNLGGTVAEEFSLHFPIIAYDEMDVDTSKEAILVKAKATAIPGTTKNSLFTAKVINEVASYAS